MVAAIAGLLPGISGSVVWIASGEYARYLNAINQGVIQDLIVFILGSFKGYVVFSLAIESLLRRFPMHSYTVLTGFTLASMLWLLRFDVTWNALTWVTQAVLPMLGGFGLFYSLYWRYLNQKRRLI